MGPARGDRDSGGLEMSSGEEVVDSRNIQCPAELHHGREIWATPACFDACHQGMANAGLIRQLVPRPTLRHAERAEPDSKLSQFRFDIFTERLQVWSRLRVSMRTPAGHC